jgi:hypothetical protein
MKGPKPLTRLPLGFAATLTASSLVGDYVGVLPSRVSGVLVRLRSFARNGTHQTGERGDLR